MGLGVNRRVWRSLHTRLEIYAGMRSCSPDRFFFDASSNIKKDSGSRGTHQKYVVVGQLQSILKHRLPHAITVRPQQSAQ